MNLIDATQVINPDLLSSALTDVYPRILEFHELLGKEELTDPQVNLSWGWQSKLLLSCHLSFTDSDTFHRLLDLCPCEEIHPTSTGLQYTSETRFPWGLLVLGANANYPEEDRNLLKALGRIQRIAPSQAYYREELLCDSARGELN